MCFYTAGEIYFLRWEFQFSRHFPSDPKFFHSWRAIGQLWIYRSQQFYDRELCTVKLIRYWGFSHLRLKNKPVHRHLPSLRKKIGRRVPSPEPVFLREGRRLCTGYRKVKQFQSLNKNRLDDSLLLEFVSFLLPARILIPTSETAMKQWHERNGMATNDR